MFYVTQGDKWVLSFRVRFLGHTLDCSFCSSCENPFEILWAPKKLCFVTPDCHLVWSTSGLLTQFSIWLNTVLSSVGSICTIFAWAARLRSCRQWPGLTLSPAPLGATTTLSTSGVESGEDICTSFGDASPTCEPCALGRVTSSFLGCKMGTITPSASWLWAD